MSVAVTLAVRKKGTEEAVMSVGAGPSLTKQLCSAGSSSWQWPLKACLGKDQKDRAEEQRP